MRDAGATAAQEVAFTLANAIAYWEAAWRVGSRSMHFARGSPSSSVPSRNFFEEVAKFRAARRLWARVVKERFGVSEPSLAELRFHAQTGGHADGTARRSSTWSGRPSRDVGGAGRDAVAAHEPIDEALGLPDRSRRPGWRCGRNRSSPTRPESPTRWIRWRGPTTSSRSRARWRTRPRTTCARSTRWGGAVRAIEQGFPQREIHEAAYRWQKRVERADAVVVGVNRFRDEERSTPPTQKIDPEAAAGGGRSAGPGRAGSCGLGVCAASLAGVARLARTLCRRSSLRSRRMRRSGVSDRLRVVWVCTAS